MDIKKDVAKKPAIYGVCLSDIWFIAEYVDKHYRIGAYYEDETQAKEICELYNRKY